MEKSEELKFLEEFEKQHRSQTAVDQYTHDIEQAQVTSQAILAQYNLQASVNSIMQNIDIMPDSLVTLLRKHCVQNRTPYLYKDYSICTDNFQHLLMYCYRLPELLQQAIVNGGMVPIYNVGFPDPEIIEMIENWMQSYLGGICPEQNYVANLIIPKYQNVDATSIYKPFGNPYISVQKRKKTK